MAVKTKAEEVVEVVATDEVNVCEPVPEVNAKAVAPVLFPTVMVLALAPVPILMAPVEFESIFNAPDESTIECATFPIEVMPVEPICSADVVLFIKKLMTPFVSLEIDSSLGKSKSSPDASKLSELAVKIT